MSSIKDTVDRIKERARQTKESLLGIKESIEDSIDSLKIMPGKRFIKRVRKRLKEVRPLRSS
jgi:hypothetical protein